MNINGFPYDYYGNSLTHFLARVENIEGPGSELNRVQVRIFGQQDMSFKLNELPWATVLLPTTAGVATGNGAMHNLQVSDLVTGFWIDPELQTPVITGVIMGGTPKPDVVLEATPWGSSTAPPAATTTQTQTQNNREPNPEPEVEHECGDAEYTDQGILGATGDRGIPATLRHNNPLGNNMAPLANRYGALGNGQRLDVKNTIASFDSTINGYGYSFHQMHLNASRRNRYDSSGRLYTTPQNIGNEHFTAGYNGNTIAGAVGHNNRMYFDQWSQDWADVVAAMEVRETGNSLRNQTRNNCAGIGSGYDFGQNSNNARAGFQSMQANVGLR